MTEQTLTARELNRALLARQMLLERADLPLTKTIERMGYVQAQYAPSSYIGLWTRRDAIRTLAADSRARAPLGGAGDADARHDPYRARPRLLADRDAIGEDGRAGWLSATRRQFPEEQVAALATQLRGLLADGPRRRKELMAELGVSSTLWNGVGGWINLLRVPPSGTWERRSADIYAVAEDWLASTAERRTRRRGRAARATVPDRLRSRVAQGHRELGGYLHDQARTGVGPDDRSDGSATSAAASCWTCHARRSPTPTHPRPFGSCRRGTPRCWCMPVARGSCQSASVRCCSTPRHRTRSQASWSTARSPDAGSTKVGAS